MNARALLGLVALHVGVLESPLAPSAHATSPRTLLPPRVTFVSHTLDAGRCETVVCWDVSASSVEPLASFALGAPREHDGALRSATLQAMPIGSLRGFGARELDAMTRDEVMSHHQPGTRFELAIARGATQRLCMRYAGMLSLGERGDTRFELTSRVGPVVTVGVQGVVNGLNATCIGGPETRTTPSRATGHWTCPGGQGPAVCSTEPANACGGYGTLPGVPGGACGTPCAPGTWTCAGQTLACDAKPVVCDAFDNACSHFACEATTGACVAAEVRSDLCDDGNACNGEEVCDAARGCVAGTQLACDDRAFCDGQEACDPDIGCVSGTRPCPAGCNEATDRCGECADGSDKNACGGCGTLAGTPGKTCGGMCALGIWYCQGASVVCDAKPRDCSAYDTACSTFACSEATGGCVPSVLDDAACDDGEFCNGAETCDSWRGCRAATETPCGAGKICDEATQRCAECRSAADCDDDQPCTEDRCEGARCAHVLTTCGSCDAGAVVDFGQVLDFNLFACGDYTRGLDVLGRAAVGGDLALASFAIGRMAVGDGPVLVVGGAADLTHGTVYGGLAHDGRLATAGVDVRGEVSLGVTLDFTAECSAATVASGQLAAIATNTTTVVSPWHAIHFATAGSGLEVFRVSAADLAAATSITIDAPAGATIVINVDGKSARVANVGIALTGGVTPNDVLWNFVDAGDLTITSVGLSGSVLAPRADVSFTNGAIDGSLVAQGVSGNGELHNLRFAHQVVCPGTTTLPPR